jgi:hypothetical protein
MNKEDFQKENERAGRILFSIDNCHTSLATIYEKLVDREMQTVKSDIKSVISELKTLMNSVDDDDF